MLATLIAGLASGETMMAVRRAKRAAIAYLIAGIFLAIGIGFLIGAGYIWTAARYGALHAALYFSAGFVVVAILVIVINKLTAEKRVAEIKVKRKSEVTAIGVTTALAILPVLLRSRAGLGLIAAPAIALAGYAVYLENRNRRPYVPLDPKVGAPIRRPPRDY